MSNTVYIDLYQAKPGVAGKLTGRPQKWRWTAKSGDNQRVLAVSSEGYTNRNDAMNAIRVLFSAEANVFLRQAELGQVKLRNASE